MAIYPMNVVGSLKRSAALPESRENVSAYGEAYGLTVAAAGRLANP
jgi:hypothetical protein